MNRLACLLLLAVPVAAQSPLRLTRQSTLPQHFGGGALAVGDIDGDGDLDLVLGNDNSPNQVFVNDGRGHFTDETAGRFANVAPNASHSIDLADIDGDGDLDILIGNDDFLANRVYRNNGAGYFLDVTRTALPPNGEFTQNQVVADFDQDGDVDWFTVDGTACHLYDNNGTGVFADISATHLHNLTPMGERYQMATKADVDGDGDLDVLVPNGGMPTLLLNQGGHLSPAATQPPSPPGSIGQYHKFVDIDGDGDQDLLLGSGMFVLQNQGNGTFVDVTAAAFPSAHTATQAIFDVDGDGDVDLLTNNLLWLNDGTGHFVAQTVAATNFNSGPIVMPYYAADFDGDGDLDVPPLMNFARQVDAVNGPARGYSWSIDFHVRPGSNSFVYGMLSLAERVTPLGALGTLRLDPSLGAPIAVQVVGSTPLRVTVPVPNTWALVGMQVNVQALVIDPLTGPRLSNAIRDIVP